MTTHIGVIPSVAGFQAEPEIWHVAPKLSEVPDLWRVAFFRGNQVKYSN